VVEAAAAARPHRGGAVAVAHLHRAGEPAAQATAAGEGGAGEQGGAGKGGEAVRAKLRQPKLQCLWMWWPIPQHRACCRQGRQASIRLEASSTVLCQPCPAGRQPSPPVWPPLELA
jgi:hypothetical protein